MPIQQEGLGLYIHWPWCKKKCPYCDFNSHVAAAAPVKAYVKSLEAQMLALADQLDCKRLLTSVFFGGGTPSLMPPQVVEQLLTTAEKTFGFAKDIEITLEANPTSSEAQKFAQFAAAGVNRMSIGMQSLTLEDLTFLGRTHNVSEAKAAINAAQKAVNNVNLDLIYGLPNQNLDQWLKNLETVFSLGTQHISCYQLTLEKNTAFYADWLKGRLTPAPDHIQADFYEQTTALLLENGYEHYEVSNYAKPNYACRHNRNIWRYGSYLGIGAGAHGRIPLPTGLTATRNFKMPEVFIEKAAAPTLGIFETELLKPTIQAFEATLLGLRLKEGLPLQRLEVLGQKPWQAFIDEQALHVLVENGLLTVDLEKQNKQNNPNSSNKQPAAPSYPTLQATEKGFLLLDSVVEHLIKLPNQN